MSKKSVSTVRNYIFSLRQFLAFLKQNPRYNPSFCDKKSAETADWLVSLKRQLASRRRHIQERDAAIVANLKNVGHRFGKSEQARKALQLLEEFQPDIMPMKEDVLFARNYIVAQLLLHKGMRAGPD